MRKLLLLVAPILLIAASLVQLTAASANEPPGEPKEDDVPEREPLDGVAPRGAIFQSQDEGLAYDIADAAKGKGVSEGEMQQKLKGQESLDTVIEMVISRYPDRYAGGFSGGDDRPTIRITGQAPADVLRLAERSGVVVADGAPLSWDEMTKAVEATAEHFNSVGMPETVTFLRVTEMEIRAHVPFRSTLTVDAIRDTAVEGITSDVVGNHSRRWDFSSTERAQSFVADSLVVVMEAEGVDNRAIGEHSYGGGEAEDGNVRECTTAFTIELPDAIDHLDPGGTGVLTAGHCNGIDMYDDQDTAPYSMPHMGNAYEHVGNSGDFELHRSTHVEPDDFWADAGVMRDVAGIEPLGTINEDDSVCVYGRSTNDRDCSADVMTAFGCNMPDHRQACGQVIMDSHVTQDGDSGGNWSWNFTAWGSHSGAPTIDGARRSTFSPVARLPGLWTGAVVRT